MRPKGKALLWRPKGKGRDCGSAATAVFVHASSAACEAEAPVPCLKTHSTVNMFSMSSNVGNASEERGLRDCGGGRDGFGGGASLSLPLCLSLSTTVAAVGIFAFAFGVLDNILDFVFTFLLSFTFDLFLLLDIILFFFS